MSVFLDAAARLAQLRAYRPLVHNITNYVAMDISANALLAIGASPAMIHAVEEAGEFAGIADALVVNIGTLSPLWVAGMEAAVTAATAAGTPWVLDPVGVGATAFRTKTARALLALGPTVVRANATEVLALSEGIVATGGVDATHGVAEARSAALALARESGAVVAMTGAVDLVTDGTTSIEIANGDPMMTRVTAVGCSASALVAAFLGADRGGDTLAAAAAALVVLGIAGEMAATAAAGPGSFRVGLIDALHSLDGPTVTARARLS